MDVVWQIRGGTQQNATRLEAGKVASDTEDDGWETCWHVSPRVNRESVARYGLDWRRIGATGGIAHDPAMAPPRPEAECVWLCTSLDDAQWFRDLTSHPVVDVWEVDVRGLPVVAPDEGWPFVLVPVGPERVRLVDPLHEP
jgi:hypothetical protein